MESAVLSPSITKTRPTLLASQHLTDQGHGALQTGCMSMKKIGATVKVIANVTGLF